MTSRKQTTLIVGITLVGLLLLLYVSSRTFLLRSSGPPEEQDLRQLMLLFLAAGVIFAVTVLVLLERTVLSRVMHLSSRVNDIGASGDLSARVHVVGHDESSNLGGGD
jgi:signal transduction histidine kinase